MTRLTRHLCCKLKHNIVPVYRHIMASGKIFTTDLDFCPDCGTVLPLPGLEDVVTCKKCGYQIDISEFDGVEIHSVINYKKPDNVIQMNENESEQPLGPKVDRKCSKCDHDEMIYTTRQTRSADEGQTVFYTCTECGNQEIEYS
ncbi:hypothetical protein ScPMuIL_010553 [Solemya velum]